MIRSALDGVYRACGAAAGCAILLIAVLVAAQVIGRLFGVLVPGADDLAGFALTASSFLALAYTLRAAGHIRMTLLLRVAGPRQRAALEGACLVLGALMTGYFGYHVVEMAWDAYRFGERSQGVLPIPLWIPQTVMAIGATVLCLALVDDLVSVLRGGRPSYEARPPERDAEAGPITREG